MNDIRRLHATALVLAIQALLASSCADRTPWPDDAIGRITVEGRRALLNGQPVGTGTWLRRGDTLVTGHGSWAQVNLRQGGEVDLDQDTDPSFQQITDAAIALGYGVVSGACILVEVAIGRVFFRGDQLCIKDNNVQAASHSSAVLLSRRDGSDLYVIAGNFSVTRPVARIVHAGEVISVTAGGGVRVRQASQDEITRVLNGMHGEELQPRPPPIPIPFPPPPAPRPAPKPAPAPAPAPASGAGVNIIK